VDARQAVAIRPGPLRQLNVGLKIWGRRDDDAGALHVQLMPESGNRRSDKEHA